MNKTSTLGRSFQYTLAVWREFSAFGNVSTTPSCLISTSGNSANTDSIRQAKVIPTLETNKQTNKLKRKWKENGPNLPVWRGQARPATTIFAHCAFRHPNHKKNIWHKRVSVLTSCLGMKTFFSSMTRSFLTHLKMGNFEKNSHVCMHQNIILCLSMFTYSLHRYSTT